MKTIGLVGGVASGKSRVARLLSELGAGVLDADRAGHEVLETDAEVREILCRRWGDSMVAAEGGIDRAAVACRVFGEGDPAAADRRFLESLLHPRIRVRLELLRDRFAAEGRLAVVLDAPLLLEAGWPSMCDMVLMVEAGRETRLARSRQRGWSDQEFARREAAQWTVEEKRRHADFVLPNDGSEEELRQAVQRFWTQQVVA